MIHVIRRHAPAGVIPLLVSEFLLLGGCFYGGAAILYPPAPSLYFLYEGGLERTLLAIASVLLALYFLDLYSDIQVHSRVLLFQQLCQAVGVALLVQSVIEYALRDFIVPHYLMFFGCAFSLISLFCWRLLYTTVLPQAIGREKLLFVGRNATVDQVAREIAADRRSGMEILGLLEDGSAMGLATNGPPVLGPLKTLQQVARESKPTRIVVGLTAQREQMPVADLLELRFAGSRIEEASLTYEEIYRRLCSRDLSPVDVVLRGELTPPPNALRLAQLMSRVLAVFLIVLLSPLLLLIALALRIRSRQPVFATLRRLGKDGRVFSMLRFRDSPGLGSLYRRFRLAALPELWNVLKGEMALVGPRPAAEEHGRQQARELPLYEYRHNVPPGMTGWAQINTPPDSPPQPVRDLEYDLYFIKHMSLALNAYILLNTFKNRVLRMTPPGP